MLGICCVEDDDDLRELLIQQISRSRKFRCVGAYATAEEALQKIPGHKPDLVLMDIGLPRMNGIECTRRLCSLLPRLNVIMLTERDATNTIFESLKAGASGYLLREHTTGRQMEEALTEVMAGGSPITPCVARKMVSHFQQSGKQISVPPLTRREEEVLSCLAQGWMYKEIADRLIISLDTTRRHLHNIYLKLHVHSRTEAVVKYVRRETSPGPHTKM